METRVSYTKQPPSDQQDINNMTNCYNNCSKEVLEDNPVFPFCSQECKDKYWEGKPKLHGQKWSIKEMQTRLTEMSEQAKRDKELYDKAKTLF